MNIRCALNGELTSRGLELKLSKEYPTYRLGIRFRHRVYLFQVLTELAFELDIIEFQGQVNDVGVINWWWQRRIVGVRITRREFSVWRILLGGLSDFLPTFVTPYLALTLAST
jgi:hypothetical protein